MEDQTSWLSNCGERRPRAGMGLAGDGGDLVDLGVDTENQEVGDLLGAAGDQRVANSVGVSPKLALDVQWQASRIIATPRWLS
jgi:hypothetical protein